jgi:DNA polymerase elongation subunit (family B)
LIDQFEEEIKTGKFGLKDIRAFIEDHTKDKKGKSQTKKLNLTNTDYKIAFYDYEIQLLRDLFQTIHRCSPDFVEGWNSSAFDIQFIIDRVIQLGYDPADILCDQRFPIKIVKNYIDFKNINMLPERGDYTFISGLPVFIDQEIQYASRRKSKYGSINSFKLDDTGYRESGIRKLDYHHITSDLGKLPYLDYKTFVLYNIMDVIVQKAIEFKTQDLEYIFSKCVVNNTVYRKGHRQSVYLINRMANDWYKKGYIIGNNLNRGVSKKPPRFAGALVGDPLKTNDYAKHKIDGRMIWICDNLQDYDKHKIVA